MTYEEALETMQVIHSGFYCGTGMKDKYIQRMFEALEKQIPKKSIRGKYNLVQCVNGHNIPCVCKENEMPYCPFCGQAIDWRENE